MEEGQVIYPYQCSCGHYEEVVRPASEYQLPAICPDCSQVMSRVWVPVPGKIDMIKNRCPKGCVELGNEKYVAKPPTIDYEAGLREELNSGRYPELAGMAA